jgi:hypothetical protein
MVMGNTPSLAAASPSSAVVEQAVRDRATVATATKPRVRRERKLFLS